MASFNMLSLFAFYIVIADGQHTQGGIRFALDSLQYAGGPRLGVTVIAQDAGGNELPSQRLLLDTGSSTLAFCDLDFASRLLPLQTQFYSCNTYGGDGSDDTGYWGAFYNGAVNISQTDINGLITQAYFSVMQQQFGMPCDSGFHGIFGIASTALDEASLRKPSSWSSSSVGSCPEADTALKSPLMQYLEGLEGNKQFGIYWSGKIGNGEGDLYLGVAATANNPHFDSHAAAEIGSARLYFHGNYNINVKELQFGGRSFDIECAGDDQWSCSLDTGCPSLTVPQDVYDAMMNEPSGELVVLLERVGGGAVKLRFDVHTLVSNGWIGVSTETILGLPLRAFYYTVMDITSSSLYFTPMAAYFQQVSLRSVVV